MFFINYRQLYYANEYIAIAVEYSARRVVSWPLSNKIHEFFSALQSDYRSAIRTKINYYILRHSKVHFTISNVKTM